MPGMWLTMGIIRYFTRRPAFRPTSVAVAAPGETAYTAIPDGSRRQSRCPPGHHELRVGIGIVGVVLHVRTAAQQRFHSCSSITVEVLGREGWEVGVLEQRHPSPGRLGAGDDDPRVGAQKLGLEQPVSQLMMADQRGLRSLDARAGEHAFLAWDQPGIEQQEIDRLTSLAELPERLPDTGRIVQIQLQRLEDLRLRLSREQFGRFSCTWQGAPGDDDLSAALCGEQAGCCMTDPGGRASDESDRMFHG